MKPQLLEYLVRACTREVLKQVNEDKQGYFYRGKGRPAPILGRSFVKENDMSAKAYADSFKIPEKDLPFVQDLMAKHNLSYEDAVRDYLDMYGANQTGKPIKFDDQPSHIGRRFTEEEETKGAPAPPAAGQGTADQPAIPQNDSKTLNDPKADADADASKKPAEPKEVKGINIVNPRDKSKLQKVMLKSKDDASIERELHRQGSSLAGSKVKVALSTMRAVKSAGPNTPLYLYIGKYDPQSEELFVLADNSLQVAKDSSADPESLTAAQPDYTAPVPFNPTMATANDFSQRMANAGQTVPQPIDETIHKLVKQMVNSILDSK
jgi:hypothetical protein